MSYFASKWARFGGKCLFLPDYGPFVHRVMRHDAISGLGFYNWGSTVGHPSNSWASYCT